MGNDAPAVLFRFRPDQVVESADLPLGFAEGVELGESDLDRLDWKRAARAFDGDGLRIALRCGRASRQGLMVQAADLLVLDRPHHMRQVQAEAARSRRAMRRNLEREVMHPCVREAHNRSDAAADTRTLESLVKADEAARRALAAPPSTELVQHWLGLGGLLPDPA